MAELLREHAETQFAEELSQLKAAQASSARSKAIAEYIGKIRSKIKGNIVLPPEIKGVINLRGKIIPVIDLRDRFFILQGKYNHPAAGKATEH